MNRYVALVFLMFAIILSTSIANATTLALAVESGSTSNEIIDITVGWSFHVNRPIRVNALGYFDLNGDGLQFSYPIGLWSADGNLLASTTISPRTAGMLIESFRFQFIDPVLLTPKDYVIGAVANTVHTGFLPGPDRVIDEASITETFPITFLENRGSTIESTSLLFPDTTFPAQGIGFFGPNFAFSAVPESPSLLLVSLGALAALVCRWCRQSH